MTDETPKPHPHIDRILRVIDYMHAHAADDLSLDQLADVAALSRFHWHRVFTAINGGIACADHPVGAHAQGDNAASAHRAFRSLKLRPMSVMPMTVTMLGANFDMNILNCSRVSFFLNWISTVAINAP